MQSRRQFLQSAGGAGLATAALRNTALLQKASAPPFAFNAKAMLNLQQRFVDLKFGMFLHFNMATFQDREWGDPTSSPNLFEPTALDTDQWAEAAKSAKMTWGCLTTRHHDGFCIWPTRTRGKSIAQTSHRTDVVRAYVDSFRKVGLRVGLYYSILSLRDDIRHFNVTTAKVQLIKDQLTELFTNYGQIDILITDGWDAPWSRITYDEVPFRAIYDHVKALQPQCLICDLNAASYPTGGLFYSDIKAFEQNAGQRVPSDSDLPALSCVTLTDGWFWKQADVNGHLKAAETVVNEWLIPLNKLRCNLILNAPPNRKGELSPNVVERLAEIGRLWKPEAPAPRLEEHAIVTTPNLSLAKPIHASSSPETVGPDLANDGNFRSAWSPEAFDTQPWLEIDLLGAHRISVITLVQGRTQTELPSPLGFRILGWDGTRWSRIAEQTKADVTTMLRIPPATLSRVRVELIPGTSAASIAFIGLYDEP